MVWDANGNGLLSDDPRLVLSPKGDGSFVAEQNWSFHDAEDQSNVIVLPVLWSVRKAETGVELYRYDQRERRGAIQVDGEKYLFALRTAFPVFDSPDTLVGIDLNRDGKIRFQESDSEVFRLEDRFLPLAGREYQMSVDRAGGSLRLAPTGRQAAARPSLEVGTKAPLLPNGTPLSRTPRLPILLFFWSPHCGASVRMAQQIRPSLGALQGVQVVTITDAPDDEALHSSSGCCPDGPQVTGEAGAKIIRLYRVDVRPTFYVVDSEGVIRARGHSAEWPEIRNTLARLAAPDSGTAKPGDGEK